MSDFSEAFQDHEVQRVLRAYPDTISIDIHCAAAGLWGTLPTKSYAKSCKIRINAVDRLDSGSERLNAFTGMYLGPGYRSGAAVEYTLPFFLDVSFLYNFAYTFLLFIII